MAKKRNKAFEIQDCLYELLSRIDEMDIDSDIDSSEVCTFADAGVLTYNAGLVITLHSGDEFQLTIVRSR